MSNPTRIVVVDDDPATRELFSEILRTEGYEVWAASTGLQGLETTRAKHPDLVLLDVVLPDLNGIEVCRRIKADPVLQDVFVILISGEITGPAHKVDGLEKGADEYLTKPMAVEELIARIRTFVRLRDTTVALRASEHHYRRLVEILPDAVSLIDEQGRLHSINPQVAAMLGYGDPRELVGKSVFDVTPPEYHERARADILTTLKTGVLRNAEYMVLTKDGRRVPVELSAAPSEDGNGQPRRLVLVARDITARKQAESRIRELLHILDQAHDAIIIRDLVEGRIQYFNQGAERLLGWSADDVRGRLPTELFFEDTSEFEAARQKLLQTGEWNGELHVLTKDRKPLIVESRWTLVPGDAGQSPHVVCINTDITKRKRAEAHMRLQSAALEAAANAIVIADRAGNFTWVNAAFTRLTGYAAEDVVGRNARFLKSGRHDPAYYAKLWQTILAGQVWQSEMINRRKDGSLYSEENTITPVRGEGGEISHFIAVKQDVTDRKWTGHLLEVQRDFAVFLSTTNDLKAAMERLLEVALQNEAVDCGGVHLFDPETGALGLAAHRGLSECLFEHVSHLDADPLLARLASAGQAIYWQQGEPMTDLTRPLTREGLTAMEAIPIRHDGRMVAVLMVGSHDRREIPARDRRMIELVAAQAGGAIARIRAEQLLRTNRQLLEKTLHSLRAAVLIVDADTAIVQECNPAATAIFGHAREELIGRTLDRLHVDEVTGAQFRQRLHSTVKRKGLLSEFEFRMRRKDGTVFPSEHSVTPIRDETGRIRSWVNVIRDISEQKQSEEELRNLSRRIIEAQEAERARVARDLHDGVNQVIASARQRLQKVEDSVVGLSPAAREMLARCDDLLTHALEENRRIARNLRPSDLDELGLAAACRDLCKRTQSRTSLVIKCDVSKAGERLPPEVEQNLFRVVQEALNNVEKHAQAQNVRLCIARNDDAVTLRIQDDGSGFGPKASKGGKGKRRGTGLTNMRERAASIGGDCQVESAPKHGTVITVRVPFGPRGGE